LADKHIELSNHIQAVHTSRTQTLAVHRDRYFFADVDDYLQYATTSQMQRYVWNQTNYWITQPHAYLSQQLQLVEPTDWTPTMGETTPPTALRNVIGNQIQEQAIMSRPMMLE
jgi:hypothetical protein